MADERDERARRRSLERARRESVENRIEKLGMKEKRDVDHESRTNKLGREQKMLKKTMTGEDLASVMALLDSRPGVIMKVDTDLSEAVGRVISLTEALKEKELKQGLANGVFSYLHGQAASSPCVALYLNPGTTWSSRTPKKLVEILKLVEKIRDMLPSALLAAGGISVIVYLGGQVLRRLLDDSPAMEGDIVVSDNYVQGYHIDVDIDMQNAGSLMWASKDSPWTDVINITYEKLCVFIVSCFHDGVTKEECEAELRVLFNYYDKVDPGHLWRLPSQQCAKGGSHVMLFSGNKPHRGAAIQRSDRVVQRVAIHTHTESPLLVAARAGRSGKANKVALEEKKRSLETGVVADVSYVVRKWYEKLTDHPISVKNFKNYERHVVNDQ